MSKSPAIASLLALASLLAATSEVRAQVYGYTDKNGVLILSNVPNDDRMRLIADGTAEEAGKVWRYNGQYDTLILQAARAYGVDSALVRAVIAVESAFNRYARSHKGAQGLMQLMPATGRIYGVQNPYDPAQNIRAGTAHLRGLIDEFGELRLALAAYNAGSTPVRRYGTIPPYRETRDYVRKVMAIYRAGSKIEIVKGGNVYSIDRPGGTARVTVYRGTQAESSPSQNGAAGSPLAELARQAAARRAAAMAPPPAPAPMAQAVVASAPEPDPSRRVYYRYVDPDGVVRITRAKPDSFPYDVLDP